MPDEKVIHNIERYGNTTAATIPLLWDEGARRAAEDGRPRPDGRLRRRHELGRHPRAGLIRRPVPSHGGSSSED